MRERLFDFLAKAVVRKTGMVLFFCILVTIIFIPGILRIKMKTDFVDMLPGTIPQVEEMNRIKEHFGTAANEIITIESNDAATDLMKKCAEDVAERLKNLYVFLPKEGQQLSFQQKMAVSKGETPPGVLWDTITIAKRVVAKMDPEFFDRYGFIIRKKDDLENILSLYSSFELSQLLTNLNNNFEKEYIDDGSALSTYEGEQKALYGLDAVKQFVEGLGAYLHEEDSSAAIQAAEGLLTGPEYMLSPDKTLLLVRVSVAEVFNSAEGAAKAGPVLHRMIQEVQRDYPTLAIGGTGDLLYGYDVLECTKRDFGVTSVISLILILLLLLGSFGTWKSPFLSMVSLVTALLWASGFIGYTLQHLNIMSIVFGVILLGLGIDFGIHMISGFRDACRHGLAVDEAIQVMYQKAGKGILTGALTTSIAFFSLSFSGFKAMVEMGVACGAGILFCMMSMVILLPALLVWNEKEYSIIGNFLRKLKLGLIPSVYSKFLSLVFSFFRLAPFRLVNRLCSFSFLGKVGKGTQNIPVSITIVLITLLTLIWSLANVKNIGHIYNFMELEAQHTMSMINRYKIIKKFEMSHDCVMLITDSLEECRNKVAQVKRIADKTGMVGNIDALSEYLPPESEQHRNIPLIRAFRDSLLIRTISSGVTAEEKEIIVKQLARLHNNIVEIGELSIAAKGEKNKLLSRCDDIAGKKDDDSEILQVADVLSKHSQPERLLTGFQSVFAETMRGELSEKTNTDVVTLGNLPESIKEQYMNDSGNSMLLRIYPNADSYNWEYLPRFTAKLERISDRVTSSSIIGMLFFHHMVENGKVAIVLAFTAIVILLMIDMRSIKYVILAVIPIIVGLVWLLGGMKLVSIRFNVANYMMLPLILGIGIDDGVHILHRYRVEGKCTIPLVLRYTGRAVLLTTLTTMIAFSSMLFSVRPANAINAQVLLIGVGACLVSSIIVLPSTIYLVERIFPGKEKVKIQV